MERAQKTIYFVRHGESAANVGNGTFQGPDTPITEHGLKQARLVAQRAAQLPIEMIVSSPWGRARATAEEVVRATGLSLDFSDLLTEHLKPGMLHGQSFEDPALKSLYDSWSETLFQPGIPQIADGESFDTITERADSALAMLAARPESHILAVTHGFFLRVLLARVVLGERLDGESLRCFIRSFTHENTGVTVFTYDEADEKHPWKVQVWNDHSHL